MNVDQNLNVDLQQRGAKAILYAKQFDALSRTVVLSLHDNGIDWEIPSDVTSFCVSYQKPDGTKGLYSKLPDGSGAVTASENMVKIKLAPQMLTCAGMVACELQMLNAAGARLSTFTWWLSVEEAASDETSEDYFNFLTMQEITARLEELEAETGLKLVATDEAVPTTQNTLQQAQCHFYPAASVGSYVIGTNGYVGIVTALADAAAQQNCSEVKGLGICLSPVRSVNGKTGAVNLTAADIQAQLTVGDTQAQDVADALDALAQGLENLQFPVTSVNGNTGAVSLTAPDVGAQAANDFHFIFNGTNNGECGIFFDESTDKLKLYVSDKGDVMEITGVATPTQADSAANKAYVDEAAMCAGAYTEMERLAVNHNKIIRVNLYGLDNCAADDALELRLFRCYRNHGFYKTHWAHPSDYTVDAATIAQKSLHRKWGYAELAGKNGVLCGQALTGEWLEPAEYFIFPAVPDWMPNGGWVQTVYPVRDGDGGILPYVDINVGNLMASALKPLLTQNSAGEWEYTWDSCGLIGLGTSARNPYVLKFCVYRNGELFAPCRNTVKIGVRRDLIDMGFPYSQNLHGEQCYVSVS